MASAVAKALKHIVAVSNSNLLKNEHGLLCRRKSDVNVEWVGGKKRLTPQKFKLSYKDVLCLESIWNYLMRCGIKF